MNTCPVCGREYQDSKTECPVCGGYNAKIAALIAEQEEEDELRTFRGRIKKILNSVDIIKAARSEVRQLWGTLDKKAVFTIYLVVAFVFALVFSVL